jgi:hypothetical protein
VSTWDLIDSVCEECGITFTQRDDPGTKRRYHSNACRQRAYRKRNGERQRRYKFEQEEAWAREESRKQRERERSERRRTGREHVPEGVPAELFPQAGDDAKLAKVRQWCFDLTKRSLWPNADPGEANADRAMVKKLRKKYAATARRHAGSTACRGATRPTRHRRCS